MPVLSKACLELEKNDASAVNLKRKEAVSLTLGSHVDADVLGRARERPRCLVMVSHSQVRSSPKLSEAGCLFWTATIPFIDLGVPLNFSAS